MEDLKNLNDLDINEVFFKIHMDFNKVDFEDVLDCITNIGDVLYYNDSLYVWLKKGEDKKSLLFSMKALKMEELYCEPIYLNQIKDKDSVLESFVKTRFYQMQLEYIDKNYKEEIEKMLNNLKDIDNLIKDKQKNN